MEIFIIGFGHQIILAVIIQVQEKEPENLTCKITMRGKGAHQSIEVRPFNITPWRPFSEVQQAPEKEEDICQPYYQFYKSLCIRILTPYLPYIFTYTMSEHLRINPSLVTCSPFPFRIYYAKILPLSCFSTFPHN